MAPIPPNQEPARNVRKRKIPLDDNGEPVIPVKKRQVAATTKPTPTSGKTSAKPTAGPFRTRAASVEEVIDDELGRSAVPHNPRNILEAADGSDDEPIGISVQKQKVSSQLAKKKKAATTPNPILAAGSSRTRAASVEEVIDDADLGSSDVPHNLQNILEAADGSDDDQPPPSGSAMDVDDGDNVVETPEEDDEAELGLFSITTL
jgi:hypothetical protein